MFKKPSRNSQRKNRHARVRRKVSGTADRPRLVVFRSSKHIYAQVVDDLAGHTLVAASSLDPTLREQSELSFTDRCRKVGELAAERAREKGIAQVVFDRGGYKYHGRVAALAEGARTGGLEF
ncbi:MAG: 50S ribosomal protein L18 [Armatimonadetes bacterium]|nr:50S ribosomal protein L18 [Armatimonadota bacterium]